MSDIAERSEFGVQDPGQLDPINLGCRLMVERLGSGFGGQEFWGLECSRRGESLGIKDVETRSVRDTC